MWKFHELHDQVALDLHGINRVSQKALNVGTRLNIL